MKRIYIYLSLLIWGCGITSCDSDHDPEPSFSREGVGRLFFQSVDLNEEIPRIITKGADFSMLDPTQFVVEIYKKNGELYKSFDTFQQLKEEGTPLELPVGYYTVKVFSYEPEPILRGKPYFSGENSFTIENHEVTQVTIECTYQSLGVEINMTDAFLAAFQQDYKVTVLQDNGESAIYSKEEPEVIYFTQDCLYLKVIVECTAKNGTEYSPRVYYLNNVGEDPEFGDDGPHTGEYFILTIDSDKISSKSMIAQ